MRDGEKALADKVEPYLKRELDEIPRYLTSDIFNQCVKKLSQNPQLIIVDEIDYLACDKKSIESK